MAKEVVNIRKGLRNAILKDLANSDKEMSFKDALQVISSLGVSYSDLTAIKVERQFRQVLLDMATNINKPKKQYRQDILKNLQDGVLFVCRFGFADQIYERDGKEIDHIEITLEMEYRISAKEVFVVDIIFDWVGEEDMIRGVHAVAAEFLMGEGKATDSAWESVLGVSHGPEYNAEDITPFLMSMVNYRMFLPRLTLNGILGFLSNLGAKPRALASFADLVGEAKAIGMGNKGELIFHAQPLHRNGETHLEVVGSALAHEGYPATVVINLAHKDPVLGLRPVDAFLYDEPELFLIEEGVRLPRVIWQAK